jgi:predicted amidophosphoribosyltransferase
MAVEVVLPAVCVSCDEVLSGGDRGLCAECRSRLIPMTGRCCSRCGVPVDGDTEPCLGCAVFDPPQAGSVMWGVYDGVLREAVLAVKHRGHDELAGLLGRRLAARLALQPWVGELSGVVSVPSHALRRLRRRWSAADLIAAVVADVLRLPLLPVLERRGLRRQSGRTRAQRRQLPRGSFTVPKPIGGHCLLVVDDVCTTGTTLRRAAEVLLRAGAEQVYCAALAHAPDPGRVT